MVKKPIGKRLIYILVCCFISVLFNTCVKPFNPDIDKYERILVVDGLLTDYENKAEVSLSYSYQVENRVPDVVRGATVFIENDKGQQFSLTESSDKRGLYTFLGTEQIGIVGSAYKLVIEIEGFRYESTLDEMLPVAKITDIKLGRDSKRPKDGVQLLLSSEGTENDSRYYMWSLDETWKFRVPMYAPRFQEKQECWTRNTTSGILIGNTVSNANNQFENYGFYFVDVISSRLSIRYSALVNQMSISSETYQYLKHVSEVNEGNGSLFDPVPASMNGNITCINDPDIPIIGNFQVSAVNVKRFYIDRNDIPDLSVLSSEFDGCNQERVPTTDLYTQDSLNSLGYVIVDTPRIEQTLYYRYSIGTFCFDCTVSGAKVTPPDWWE